MTVTAEIDKVKIFFAGSETAIVIRGAGNSQTITITNWQDIEHTYASSTNSRTITIAGTNITGLHCLNNQLTALDISKNTALTHLACQNNQPTVDALNVLFETLHGNTIPDQSKYIWI